MKKSLSPFLTLLTSLSILVLLGGGCSTSSEPTSTKSSQNSKTSASSASKNTPAASGPHILGKGKLTLVEFADTECPYSKEYHTILENVMPAYQDKIRWEYKHFPLNQHLKKATLEAEATECAGAQGKFWEYVSLIFERTPSNNGLPEEQLFTIAKELKLNQDAFNTCLATATYNSKVKQEGQEAQKYGADGTPFSLLLDENGNVIQTIDGMYSAQELEDIFKKELAQ